MNNFCYRYAIHLKFSPLYWKLHFLSKMVHPGEAEDTSIINMKQDKRRYLSRNEIQRSYDKLYCEKELKDDVHVIKELTYPYKFAVGSDAAYAPGVALHGLRPRDASINFAEGLYTRCVDFGTELSKGKDYVIKGAIMDPIFTTPLLPPFHGFNISMKLGRDEDHMRYIEDYSKLTSATTAQVAYRFYLQKTGTFKVKCRYDTSSLTTAALARYNDQFENNKAVDVATFMVYKLDHRNIEKDATEFLNFKFPNTSNMPCLATLTMMDQVDFNHTSVRANYFSNIFLNNVKQIKFSSASDLNPTYQDGVNTIDLNDPVDRDGSFKSLRRYLLGRENVNMSDLLPAFAILNSARF